MVLKNYSVCDSMLIGQESGAHTFPYISSENPSSSVEHEATTSRSRRRTNLLLDAARYK